MNSYVNNSELVISFTLFIAAEFQESFREKW